VGLRLSPSPSFYKEQHELQRSEITSLYQKAVGRSKTKSQDPFSSPAVFYNSCPTLGPPAPFLSSSVTPGFLPLPLLPLQFLHSCRSVTPLCILVTSIHIYRSLLHPILLNDDGYGNSGKKKTKNLYPSISQRLVLFKV
jgi:hypothetical protein